MLDGDMLMSWAQSSASAAVADTEAYIAACAWRSQVTQQHRMLRLRRSWLAQCLQECGRLVIQAALALSAAILCL